MEPDPRIIRLLGKLKSRLLRLGMSLSRQNLEEAKTELSKCDAMTENIRTITEINSLNPLDYFEEFQEIEEARIDISRKIERMQNTWWRRAWSGLKTSISGLFKIGRIVLSPLLGPYQDPYILPEGDD